MSEFNPRWVFHATLAPRPVQTQAELDDLGPGWADSPQAAHKAQVDAELAAQRDAAQAAQKQAEEADRLAAIDREAARVAADNAEARRVIASQEAGAKAEAADNEARVSGGAEAPVVVEYVVKAEKK